MNRRDFIKSMGLATGAVAFGGVALAADSQFLDATLSVGDIFTIEGYFARHPITHEKLDFLQEFIVTGDMVNGEMPIAPFASLKQAHAVGRKAKSE